MRADGANLLRFLKNADQLVVPLYQRRYSWTEDEWRQLWADILRVADDPEHVPRPLWQLRHAPAV